jgi:hypothetical protein
MSETGSTTGWGVGSSIPSVSRRVKKLKLRNGGSFPTFFVLDGCCTTSLPWTLE